MGRTPRRAAPEAAGSRDSSDPAAADDLAATSTAYFDPWWDEAAGLLWNPPGAYTDLCPPAAVHLVPQSAWYAIGLLRRDRPGDRDRAARTLRALLTLQYDEPGGVIHGTFARFAEWPHPPADPVMWDDYDPNWRQFLGCAFGLALNDFPERLPEDLSHDLRRSIGLAVTGEPPGRVEPWYSNIALMKAWLDVEHGSATHDSDLVEQGERLARLVVERFNGHGAFDEYNSATYYGIDLYALALWERRSPSALLRREGRRLAELLWRDTARWYHADLRNLAGPYTRAYSMDLTRSLGLLGLWIWAAVGRDAAPVPPIVDPGTPEAPGAPLDHGHDFALGPLVAHLGTRPPADVTAHLLAFGPERTVEQQLDGGRLASAWLAPAVMIGAEGGGTDWGGWDQVHLATLHWRHPSGGVGWLRACAPGRFEARAERGRLELTAAAVEGRPLPCVVVQPGPGAPRFGPADWRLPGLDVVVETDGRIGVPRPSPPSPDAQPAGEGPVGAGFPVTVDLSPAGGGPNGTVRLSLSVTAR